MIKNILSSIYCAMERSGRARARRYLSLYRRDLMQ